MEAKIIKKTKDVLLISWAKKGVGFGELSMQWDKKEQHYIMDTECMATDHVIEVFKALKID